MPKATIRNIDGSWQIAVNGHRLEDLVTSFNLDMSGPNDMPELVLTLQTDVGLDLDDVAARITLVDADSEDNMLTLAGEAVAHGNG